MLCDVVEDPRHRGPPLTLGNVQRRSVATGREIPPFASRSYDGDLPGSDASEQRNSAVRARTLRPGAATVKRKSPKRTSEKMAYEHDQMAHAARRTLLSQLRQGTADWTPGDRLTTASTEWQGVVDWPRPDGGLQDATTDSSLAIEFKPPGHSKREYVTGLGQAMTYLNAFEYSLLIIPKFSRDGFQIALYLGSTLRQVRSEPLPIGLISYESDPADASDLTTHVRVTPRRGDVPSIPQSGTGKVFWAYWRDLSPHDAFQIMRIMDRRGWRFEAAFRAFWKDFMAKGKALTWEDAKRKMKNPDVPTAEMLNTELSLRHIGVLGSDENLTDEGLTLLRLGVITGDVVPGWMVCLVEPSERDCGC